MEIAFSPLIRRKGVVVEKKVHNGGRTKEGEFLRVESKITFVCRCRCCDISKSARNRLHPKTDAAGRGGGLDLVLEDRFFPSFRLAIFPVFFFGLLPSARAFFQRAFSGDGGGKVQGG